MSANPKFLSSEAHVDAAAVAPLPNSQKIYVTGSRPDIRVPMREITQADTPTGFGGEKNPPIYVYDTSGPYTDPEAKIDIRAGLPALRQRWIEERGDTDPCLDRDVTPLGRLHGRSSSIGPDEVWLMENCANGTRDTASPVTVTDTLRPSVSACAATSFSHEPVARVT